MTKSKKSKKKARTSCPIIKCPTCMRSFKYLSSHFRYSPHCRPTVEDTSTNVSNVDTSLAYTETQLQMNSRIINRRNQQATANEVEIYAPSLSKQERKFITHQMLNQSEPKVETFDYFESNDMDEHVVNQHSMKSTFGSNESYLRSLIEPFVRSKDNQELSPSSDEDIINDESDSLSIDLDNNLYANHIKIQTEIVEEKK